MASLHDVADNVLLGYNSDEEFLAKEDAKEYLRWRHDDTQEDSLSDWTIQIVTTTSTTTTLNQPLESSSDTNEGAVDNGEAAVVVKMYHVHRYALATGPRRSAYFARLFQHDGFAESQSSTSHIELEEIAAKAFPVLLDFLYAPPHVMDVPFTTENATALYSLAKYFDVPRLRWLAKQFWSKDIQSSKACGTYYEHAKILQEDALLQVAVRAFGEHILGGDAAANAKILNIMKTVAAGAGDDHDSVSSDPSDPPSDVRRHLLDAHFWQHYLPTATATTTTMTTNLSLILSQLLAEFFRLTYSSSSTTVTLDLLNEFTAPKYLPQIHVDAALLLLDIERKLLMAEQLQQQQHKETTTTMAATAMIASATMELSSLQERCIQALAQKWDCIDLEEEPHKTLLQQQDALVVSKIYSASLATAKVDKQEMSLERDRLLAKTNQQQVNQQRQEGDFPSSSSSRPVFSFGNSARSSAADATAAGARSGSSSSSHGGMNSFRIRQPRSPGQIQRRPQRVQFAPSRSSSPPLHHWWLESESQRLRHDLAPDRQVDYHDDDDTY